MAVTGGTYVVYRPGSIVTFKAAAAITHGTLVEITTGGMTVQTAGAASLAVIGVALQTCTVAGDQIAVQLLGYVSRLKAKGNVAAGDQVAAGTDGLGTVSTIVAVDNTSAATVATGVTNTRARIGLALEAIADGLTGQVYVKA